MRIVPPWILAATATLSGLYWLTKRREKGLQARKDGQAKKDGEAAHEEEV
jgi:hypothetical protein